MLVGLPVGLAVGLLVGPLELWLGSGAGLGRRLLLGPVLGTDQRRNQLGRHCSNLGLMGTICCAHNPNNSRHCLRGSDHQLDLAWALVVLVGALGLVLVD
jgi:hypothetical protein